MLVSIASPLMQPSPNGRRVGIRIVTFEACSGFTHVTARRIAQPPTATPAFARAGSLSRGSGPSGYPAEPLVSYQINRQFSGWLLPPQVIRAFRAHCQEKTSSYRILRGRIAIDARSGQLSRTTVENECWCSQSDSDHRLDGGVQPLNTSFGFR